MITSREEYLQNLTIINDANKPLIAALIPKSEPIYEIDLNTRTIKAPNFVAVEGDHNAETIYFKVDRYYDSWDLAHSACLIQYQNSGIKESLGSFYLIPYYDLITLKDEGKIILPWMISNSAAAVEGTVTFSFRFFELDLGDEEGNYKYIYCLNTKPASTKILNSINILGKADDSLIDIDPDAVTILNGRIQEIQNQMGVYWIEA